MRFSDYTLLLLTIKSAEATGVLSTKAFCLTDSLGNKMDTVSLLITFYGTGTRHGITM